MGIHLWMCGLHYDEQYLLMFYSKGNEDNPHGVIIMNRISMDFWDIISQLFVDVNL